MKKKLLKLLSDKAFSTAALSMVFAALAYFNMDLPPYATNAIEWSFLTGIPLGVGYLLPNKKQRDMESASK